MVRYRQNNNWTRTGIILNKNDILQPYTLLNDKVNVIRRNGHHLIKMDSNFVKIENDNDINNDVETESKARHSTSATKPGEKDEPRENATELRERSNYTTRSGRRVIKPSRYGEERTLNILTIAGESYEYPSCSTILFVFVCTASVVFMLLHYLTTTPSFLCSQTKVHSIHFIYHSPSHSFY